ncbi:hypothetical protein [Neisseria shayeganii]|uniref:Uncharacterized protein n=1 Tax=Neisseria shayeganii TaxID=607712 RepID=A0A7D7SIH2_9NEIS|nr:hypothetical protein [Neisseria shayeganii]QMT41369.1 hypothetical protein H3L94_04915 [Neisseria shayeganii]
MSQNEFKRWAVYFERYPFDDFHLTVLPAAIQISASTGRPLDEIIKILTGLPERKALPEEPPPSTPEQIDMSIFQAFGTVPPKSFTQRDR